MATKINPAVTSQQLNQGTQVPAGYTAPVVASAAKASTAAAEMPRAGQRPSVIGTSTNSGLQQPDKQYSGQSTSNTMQGNPLDFQEAIYQMDKHARNVQDLQDQKNALLGVLYQSNVSPEIMAKLTPEQARAIQTGRRETIDSQVRSLNNQIEGRYTDADASLKYINALSEQTQNSQNQLLDLLKDPEGQTFVKNNLTQEGRDYLKNAGIDVDSYSTTTSGKTKAQRNNNPGNIKDPVTGEFRVFNNVEEGKKAWLDDFTAKATGNSRTGLKPESTLAEFISVYAPSSDNNNVKAYIDSVVKNTGIRQDATIADILEQGYADQLGEAMFKHEGFYNNTTSQGTENSEAYKTQIKLSRIATADKKDIIDEIDALVKSGASEEEIDKAALDGLFAKASSDNQKNYSAAGYQISALDDVLNAIDDGSFKQEGGIFGESFKQSLKQFGKTSPYGDSVRALFSATTATERQKLFGATLTANEQTSAGLFLPTTKDTTESLKFKLNTLKDINEIAKKTSLGLRADETIKDLAAERKKELDRLNNGKETQPSNLSQEDQDLAKKYNIKL